MPHGCMPGNSRTCDTRVAGPMAILDRLEETRPAPAPLPDDPVAPSRLRAAVPVMATGIHPRDTLRVPAGLTAFSRMIATDAPGLADLCLVPKLYNAHRRGCDLVPLPRLTRIEARGLALPAFDTAHPET